MANSVAPPLDTSKIKLFVAIPAYGGNVGHACVISLIKFEKYCAERKLEVCYQILTNESLIPRGRNKLCDMFLKTDCTHLFFVDSDIQFEPDDIFRMLETDLEFIGGIYPKKTIHLERINDKNFHSLCDFVVMPFESTQINDIFKPVPVRFIGTGQLLLKRSVFEKIMEKFSGDEYYYYADDERYYCFFDTERKYNIYLSEDYYMCDKWKEAGGTVYAAFWSRCTHWGIYGFDGSLIK
jgi:hypothetical protein